MDAVEAAVVIVGTLALAAVMIAVMTRVICNERRRMERRRAEWIADGSMPEEEPNFYSGPGGGA